MLYMQIPAPQAKQVERLNLLGNPIGNKGANVLKRMFKQNTNIRTVCGIGEGIVNLHLNNGVNGGMNALDLGLLTSELLAKRATGKLRELDLSNNVFGEDVDVVLEFFEAVWSLPIKSVTLENCRLTSRAIGSRLLASNHDYP